MNTMMKRVISLILCFVLVVGYVPVGTFAAEDVEPAASTTEATTEPTTESSEETEEPSEETEPSTEATEPSFEADELPADKIASDKNAGLPEEVEEEIPVTGKAVTSAGTYSVPGEYAERGFTVEDAAIIFTDLHTNNSGRGDFKQSTINGIMGNLKNTGLPFTSVTSGGDAFSDNSSASNNCYTDTITGYIQAALGDEDGPSDIPVNYVWSDHDRSAKNNSTEKVPLNKKSHLSFENENYYVYSLSMGDIGSYDRYKAKFNDQERAAAGFTPTVDQAIAEFKAAAEKMDKTRPLLIVSHMPLFNKRNDNAFAEKWYNAISEVAKEMDVFYFYGHNHNHETGNDYYYAKGDTLTVATTGGWYGYQTGSGYSYNGTLTGAKKENINFTHVCGGYMEPTSTGSQGSTTRRGNVMVVVLLQNDEGDEVIHLVTYDDDGKYTGNYALDATVESVYEKTATPEPDPTPDPEPDPTPDPDPIPDVIPEGYTLDHLEVVNQGKTKYFRNDALDTENLSVVAVYTMENATDIRKTLTVQTAENEDGYTISGVDMSKAGKQYVTVTYNGSVGSFAIEVFETHFENEAGTVAVDFTNYGITTVAITEEAREVSGYSAYVTYDITPTGYTQGDEATVTIALDTDLFDESRPVKVLDQGAVIATPEIQEGKITFTTNHFSEYDVAQVDDSDVAVDNSKWIEVIPATGGTTTYTYTRVNSITAGGEYVIVANNAGYALDYTVTEGYYGNTTVSMTSDEVDVSSNGTTMTSTSELTQWKFSGTSGSITISNGNYTLGYSSGMGVGSSRSAYVQSGNSNNFVIKRRNSNAGYALYCNNGSWTSSNSSTVQYVRLYKLTKTETVGGTGATYGQLVGETNYQVILGTTEAAALKAVKDGMTVYYTTDPDSAIGNIYDDDGAGMSWTIDGYEPNVAGEYTVTIKYNNVTLGTATVKVIEKTAWKVELEKYEGTVERDSGDEVETGAYLRVYWNENDTAYERVPVTVGMISAGDFNVAKNGSYKGLTVSYGGKSAGNFTLNVVNKSGLDDYPVYPNPGSIDVKKSAAGVDFQNTGIARVELSTSGLPAISGADVIIMLDTSSSMTKNAVTGSGGKMRSAVLEESLANLITQFKTGGPGGTALDINVAIADFNGYYGDGSGGTSGTAYDRTSGDYVKNGNSNGSGYSQPSEAKVYTGNGTLSAGAFIKASDLAAKYTLNYTSGTNYDYAFDAIYQLGTAIKAENGENQRPLYVIFMSDGASLQWNYFGTQNGYTKWNNWLAGTWDADDLTTTNLNSTAHKYFYDLNDHDNDGHINEHRMANAIKGDPNDTFEIIRKSTAGLPAGTLTSAGKDYLYTVPGLGATMFTINFDAKQDGQILEENIDKALASTATDKTGETQYYYKVTTAAELAHAFDTIGTEISYAASNARYVDQMGDSFNLQLNPNIKTSANTDGYTTTNTDIVITTQRVYTEKQIGTTVGGHTVTEADVGKPYGTGTALETVSFNVSGEGVLTAVTTAGGYKLPDGTVVEANKTNILVGGVIYGKNFFYNNNNAAVTVTLANGSTYSLPGETFYWNIGIINEVRYTISYTVYLEGSMDGYAPPAASYETNNFAVLYYTNHVGNEVSKSVASPSLAWLGANVSYAFYLVDNQGRPLYADGTQAPNFLQAHKLTQPVVYDNQLLLNDVPVTLTADALAVLPQGYSLYDPNATYTVYIQSGDAAGAYWLIGGDKPASTYVVGYEGPNDYSNEKNATTENHPNYDYTHTTVYFAVQWIVGAVQDTVVIDYGLSVDVNVMYNDMFDTAGTLHAVGKREAKPQNYGPQLAAGFNTKSVKGDFGTAEIKDGKIRYTLSDMDINNAEKLAYAVDYDGTSNQGYYYGDLTIIPATTVYYEDEFVDLKTANRPDTTTTEYTWTNGWPTDSVAAGGTQAEDRPGMHNLPVIDANNGYGYDQAYDQMSTHSMGNAAMIHVNALQYGTAEFTFWGTGFDVVSTTSNDTGTLVVQVYKAGETTPMQSHAVDTYYGYAYGLYTVTYEVINGLWTLVGVGDPAPENATRMTKAEIVADAPVEEGNTASGYNYAWKPVGNDPNALYQVPVMQYSGLPYDQYTVKITALYYPTFDATEDEGYDLYLDAIRIYDPAGNGDQVVTPGEGGKPGTTIRDIYATDGELWPEYHELRTMIIKAGEFDKLAGKDDKVEGIIFIDGNEALDDETAFPERDAITDYTNFGPNNELYLASGQAVAFDMHLGTNKTDDTGKLYTPLVRIGLKTVGGEKAVAEMWNAVVNGDTVTRYNAISDTLLTATDMYYDITVLDGRTVVIRNSGEEGSILSITNIKVTYKPATTSTAGINDATANNEIEQEEPLKFSVSKAVAEAALLSLAEPVQEEIPEDTVPSEPDNSELQIAVAEAKQLKEKNYTKASFKAVKTALKAAEKVVKKANATQDEIDAALKTLKNAVADLVALPNNSALKTAVADAKKLKEANFTKESFAAFKKTLKAAEKVLKDKKATQSQIDRALAELNEAVNALSGSAVAKKPGKGK